MISSWDSNLESQLAVLPSQSFADSSRAGIIGRHVLCAESSEHFDESVDPYGSCPVAVFNNIWEQKLTLTTVCKHINTKIVSQ